MPGVSVRSPATVMFRAVVYPRKRRLDSASHAVGGLPCEASEPLATPGGVRVLAHRNPMLLLRFVGVLLLRDAERRFVTSLFFHDPPRITRLPVKTPIPIRRAPLRWESQGFTAPITVRDRVGARWTARARSGTIRRAYDRLLPWVQ